MGKILNWTNVLILFLLSVILMLSILHRETLEFVSQKQDILLTQTDNVLKLEDFQADKYIHTILKSTLRKSDADWVVFWGFHNGKTTGPIHLKKMSVISEVGVRGKPRFYPVFQNWNLNLFSSYYIIFWDSKEPKHSFIEDVNNENIKIHFGKQGVFFKNSIPIFLENSQYPVGLLSLYYAEEKAKELKSNPHKINLQTELLKQSSEDIEVVFSQFTD